MSLCLEVGILADLKNDLEGFQIYREQFEALNSFLRDVGLPLHNEPSQCEVWSCDVLLGPLALYYLRRLAAHLDLEGELPVWGNHAATEDPVLKLYYEKTGHQPGFLTGEPQVPNQPPRAFDHLVLHSDTEGFYLPLELDQVQYPSTDYGIWGGILGSSYCLLRECERIASVLEIPPGFTDESTELLEAADSQGEGLLKWEQYGVESHTCVCLIQACQKSTSSGASIVFV